MDIQKVSENSFRFMNTPVAFVNGIRRTLLSELPHIAFDPKPNGVNTVIEHNSGVLYNELITSRISLVPLKHIEPCTIDSRWNTSTQKREYNFKYPSLVPRYSLDVINNDISPLVSNSKGRHVTTDDFQYMNTPEQKLEFEKQKISIESVHKIFQEDKITKDPCLCTILQPSLSSLETEKQRLALSAAPIIGCGKDHSCFVQVGTASMEFVQNEDIHEEEFQKQVQQKNSERVSKGRNTLTEYDLQREKEKFNTIDKQRHYHTNKYGEPNVIQLNIESINDKSSDQLLFDSVHHLHLTLTDIYSQLKVTHNIPNITFSLHQNMIRSVNVVFNNHGHTIGNILSTVMQNIFIDNRTFQSAIGSCLQFSSYRVPHPLYPSVELRVQFSSSTDLPALYETLRIVHSEEMTKPFSLIGLSKLIIQECIRFIENTYIEPTKKKLEVQKASFTSS